MERDFILFTRYYLFCFQDSFFAGLSGLASIGHLPFRRRPTIANLLISLLFSHEKPRFTRLVFKRKLRTSGSAAFYWEFLWGFHSFTC